MGVLYYKDESGKVYPVNKGPRGAVGPGGGAEDVAEHEAKPNPHDQYLTADEVTATEPPANLAPDAVIGASSKFAREDHAHARPTPAEIGAVSTEGGTVTGDLNLTYFTSVWGGDFNGSRLTGLGSPVDDGDGSTKGYADTKWTMWAGTQSEYDSITEKDPNTLYVIV